MNEPYYYADTPLLTREQKRNFCVGVIILLTFIYLPALFWFMVCTYLIPKILPLKRPARASISTA
jgi:hypothetical protein